MRTEKGPLESASWRSPGMWSRLLQSSERCGNPKGAGGWASGRWGNGASIDSSLGFSVTCSCDGCWKLKAAVGFRVFCLVQWRNKNAKACSLADMKNQEEIEGSGGRADNCRSKAPEKVRGWEKQPAGQNCVWEAVLESRRKEVWSILKVLDMRVFWREGKYSSFHWREVKCMDPLAEFGDTPPPHTHAPCIDMLSAWGTQQVHNLFLETKHDPGSRGQLPPTVKYYDESWCFQVWGGGKGDRNL